MAMTLGDEDYNRALDEVEAGNLVGALDAVESALMHDSKQADYWQLYAALLNQAGRAEDAAKAMVKAKEFGLDEVGELLIKANEAAGSKEWNKAVTACEDALEIDAERAEVWATYAANLQEGGYGEDALGASLKAIELEGDSAHFWYLRGRILRLAKRLEDASEAEAKASFLKAKELNFPDPGVEEALKILEGVG